MNSSFIHMETNHNLRVNKTDFHMKGFTLGLALKQRRNTTRKSTIFFHPYCMEPLSQQLRSLLWELYCVCVWIESIRPTWIESQFSLTLGPGKGNSGLSLSRSYKIIAMIPCNIPVMSQQTCQNFLVRAETPSAWWLCYLNLSLETLKRQTKRKKATN